MRNHSYENEFDLHENETACRTHFQKNGFALRLALKQRHKGTRKWPIDTFPIPQRHRDPHKRRASGLFEIYTNKEMYGEILKSLNIVNLYRGMSKLKLKMNVNLLQLLCIVVSVALHGEFERFGGFCVDCNVYQRSTQANAKPTKSLKFAI